MNDAKDARMTVHFCRDAFGAAPAAPAGGFERLSLVAMRRLPIENFGAVALSLQVVAKGQRL
jgi:hypothetical protein